MGQKMRIGSIPLSIQISELPPYVIAEWRGKAPAESREIATSAVGELLSRDASTLVLELSRLEEVSEAVLSTLVRTINETQRLGRSVCLVRCPDDLFRRLQRAGTNGVVTHAASLLAATDGLARESSGTLDLYLRSCPEYLCRLRSVMSVVAREARLDATTEFALSSAVTEAAANAIRHGSPEGPRNRVRVSFHLDSTALVVDVVDQGHGFDPDRVPIPDPGELRENGYGIHMMREMMDRVEFFHDDRGMLVRMTKYI